MIEMIQRPRIETEELSNDNTYGRFMVEPLERGFGTTLGNSLRRVLLSSLPGVAPKSIKIDGVVHEFSTIPGVKEDVTEIIMNLKSTDPHTGLLVPVWDFFGSRKVEGDYDGNSYSDITDYPNWSFLTINAVDGSIIDRDLGY